MSPPRNPRKWVPSLAAFTGQELSDEWVLCPASSLKVVEAEFEPRKSSCRTHSLDGDLSARLQVEFFLFQIPGGAETVPLVTRRAWVAVSTLIIRVFFPMGCPVQSDATGPV